MMFFRDRIIAVLICSFVASGCAASGTAPPIGSPQPAPAFSLTSMDGQKISLSELRGKVVVMDFWATWCPPCREGLPHVQQLASDAIRLKSGLTVMAVNEAEDPAMIRDFLDQHRLTLTVLQDSDGSTARDYSVSTLPTTIVIGRDGMIQAVISGWTRDTPGKVEAAVAHALDAPIP